MNQDAIPASDEQRSNAIRRELALHCDAMLREISSYQEELDAQREALTRTQSALHHCERRFFHEQQTGPVLGLTLNQDTTVADVSAEAAVFLGEDAEQLLGRRFASFIVPDERERCCQAVRAALEDDLPHAADLVLQRSDGALFDVRMDCQKLPSPGKPVRLRISLVDISELKRLQNELSAFRDTRKQLNTIPNEDWLHGVIDQSLAGIYLIQEGHFAYANQGFADIFGYPSATEIIGKLAITELIVPEDRARVQENIRRRAEGEVPEMRYTFNGLRKDGSRIVVEVHGRRMIFEGRPAVIGVILDVTERKQAEQQLRIAATAFQSQEGMFVTDANQVILRTNSAFSAITGFSVDQVVGHPPSLFHSDQQNAGSYAAMWEKVTTTGSWQGEIMDRRANNELYPAWLSITAVRDAEDRITNYVATLTDITERKKAEAEIEYLAFYDQLTRLPNRRLLLDRLQQSLASSVRSGAQGALLYIDLDNFKDLNDTLGHEQGDLLLQMVAERLRSCSRIGDTVARVGGDEFVVVIEGLDENTQEAAAQSKEIGEKILATLSRPYPLGDLVHHSTPSIGVTLFKDQQNSIKELLKRADLAMYKAKSAGRNALRFYDPAMQDAVTERTKTENDLRLGLRAGHFLLHYQPQVNLQGQLIGAEALVRWQHPLRGLVSPAEFIPVAEACGLILQIGNWVLRTSCQQLVAWAMQPRLAHLSIAVNVSARQFHHPEFVNQVLAVLSETGANPRQLKLELTESLLLDNVEDMIEKMVALRHTGVGFSLDDFGTGYSSLSYLKRLPLDQLKIDKSFVNDILTSNSDAAITSTIIALAKNLGLSVIAEGVETQEQHTALARQGCHAYQGYFFGRPVALRDFESAVNIDQPVNSPGVGAHTA